MTTADGVKLVGGLEAYLVTGEKIVVNEVYPLCTPPNTWVSTDRGMVKNDKLFSTALAAAIGLVALRQRELAQAQALLAKLSG